MNMYCRLSRPGEAPDATLETENFMVINDVINCSRKSFDLGLRKITTSIVLNPEILAPLNSGRPSVLCFVWYM
jgi:hypothetical protein